MEYEHKYMTIELEGVGIGIQNSRPFQGFRGALVLTKMNLNTHSSYFLDSLSIFPTNNHKNKICPLEWL